ncbi:MAG: hypothetical protein AVDCRST_MAG89-2307 [uncultured Gemmatimonadetes bacterium]|uniref:Bacteriophage T5 Orf172 DNA-binding domain-containing protein n=1 Tax=uncultured Gemmatimonadota bacterium TaxID=203437 RepID=A0A6J4LKS9_9BACT|nr:MAG: hypothetical protein AVDCRST_MAG89-2307 [uncultured Gemmatimonadota bacterium]
MDRGTVYFLADDAAGLIKIGQTTNLAQRIGQLRRGGGNNHERRVLGAIADEGLRLERRLHSEFGDLRADGEWFLAEERLTSWIAANVRPLDADGNPQIAVDEREIDRLTGRYRCWVSFQDSVVVLLRYLSDAELAEELAIEPDLVAAWRTDPATLAAYVPPDGWRLRMGEATRTAMAELHDLFLRLINPLPGERPKH